MFRPIHTEKRTYFFPRTSSKKKANNSGKRQVCSMASLGPFILIVNQLLSSYCPPFSSSVEWVYHSNICHHQQHQPNKHIPDELLKSWLEIMGDRTFTIQSKHYLLWLWPLEQPRPLLPWLFAIGPGDGRLFWNENRGNPDLMTC